MNGRRNAFNICVCLFVRHCAQRLKPPISPKSPVRPIDAASLKTPKKQDQKTPKEKRTPKPCNCSHLKLLLPSSIVPSTTLPLTLTTLLLLLWIEILLRRILLHGGSLSSLLWSRIVRGWRRPSAALGKDIRCWRDGPLLRLPLRLAGVLLLWILSHIAVLG